MGSRISEMGVALVLATVLWIGATGQSSSCTNVLTSLTPCLSNDSGNSTTASSDCCTQLASVVQSQPECLCQVLNGGAPATGLINVIIDQTQALTIPAVCNIQTPSISNCNSTRADSSNAVP